MTAALATPSIDFSKLTLQDALDLAVLIEEEARDRYEELASQLALHHTPSAAVFFNRMMGIEELHRTQLMRQRTQSFGTAPGPMRRELIYDVEAPDYDEVRINMSQRQALETALRSEEKAFQFFDDALRSVNDPEVRKLFETLRGEELEHQRLVKAELAKLKAEGPNNDDDYSDDPAPQ